METLSDEYSTDDGTRKRRAVMEIDKGFERSKKTSRSPMKLQKKEDERWDQIIGMLTELKLDQKEIKEEIQLSRAEQKGFTDELLKLKQENENLRKENQEIKNDNKQIKDELRKVKKNIEYIEKEKKKNNIVITGLLIEARDADEIKNDMQILIKQQLKIDTKIKSTKKLGQKACLLELEDEKEKEKIMKSKYKLKNMGDGRIYINDDLTENERRKQKQIREIARDQKSKGKEVKIGYNKIIIDGEEWRWDSDLEELKKVFSKNG